MRYLALAPLARKTSYGPLCAVPIVSFHDGRILRGTGDECEISPRGYTWLAFGEV